MRMNDIIYIFTKVIENEVVELEVYELYEEAEMKLKQSLEETKEDFNNLYDKVKVFYDEGDNDAYIKSYDDLGEWQKCELKITQREI